MCLFNFGKKIQKVEISRRDFKLMKLFRGEIDKKAKQINFILEKNLEGFIMAKGYSSTYKITELNGLLNAKEEIFSNGKYEIFVMNRGEVETPIKFGGRIDMPSTHTEQVKIPLGISGDITYSISNPYNFVEQFEEALTGQEVHKYLDNYFKEPLLQEFKKIIKDFANSNSAVNNYSEIQNYSSEIARRSLNVLTELFRPKGIKPEEVRVHFNDVVSDDSFEYDANEAKKEAYISSIKCSNCEHELSEHHKGYCPYCGEKVGK